MSEELSELDIEYHPSRWSKRFGPEVVFEKHHKFVNEASLSARSRIPCQLNIPYGSGEKQLLDVFGTDLNKDAPIFVFVHGGYWQMPEVTKDLYSFICENMYKNKIKTILVGYDLCPTITMPQLRAEMGAALRKIIEYAKKNGSKSIYLSGHSAGAHLIIDIFTSFIKSILEDRHLIKAAFLLAGIYDLVPLIKSSINEPLKMDEELAKQMSPMFHNIIGGDTKFYVVAAENDAPPFVSQAEILYEKIKSYNLKCEHLLLEERDHFDLVELLADENYALTKLILDEIEKTK